MSTALKAYDDAWLRIIADSESMHGSFEALCEEALSSASASGENEASCVDNDKLLEEFFNSQTSACPHLVSLQPSIDEGTLDWLTNTYLWGDAAHHGYSDDGRKRYQSGRVYTAAQKLEELIVESHARRMRYCRDPARDIVQENDLQSMLKEWKDVRSGLLSNSNHLFLHASLPRASSTPKGRACTLHTS